MVDELMESKKQINFDKPLLSVRRISSKVDKSLPVIPQPPHYKSDIISGPLRNPGTVPFVWEQSPGKPKDDEKPKPKSPASPKLPPGRVLRTEDEKNLSSDEGDEEEYEDAHDTLSRTESYFINCSVSGLSELDDPDMKTKTQNDLQTRDFMMCRFLPAAKAMAIETPRHGTRKVISDDEYDEREILRSRVCGLLPCLGFKSSFSVLNPLPGTNMRSRSPMSTLSKIQGGATSSSSDSCGEHERVSFTFRELLAEQNESESETRVDKSLKIKEIESSINDIKKLRIVEKETKKDTPKPFVEYLENYSGFPVPPPLPKTPTDSWLGRTLPSISARKLLGKEISTKSDTFKTKSSDPKWENIVKMNETRLSEGRLQTISET